MALATFEGITFTADQRDALRDSLLALKGETHHIVDDFLEPEQTELLIAAAASVKHYQQRPLPHHTHETVVTSVDPTPPASRIKRASVAAWKRHYGVSPYFDELGGELAVPGPVTSLPLGHFSPNTLTINRMRPGSFIGEHRDLKSRVGAIAVVSLGPAILDIQKASGEIITVNTRGGSLEVMAGLDTAERNGYKQPLHSVRTVPGNRDTRYSLVYSMEP